MTSIKELNEDLARDWKTNESARKVLYSMLEDSEDDNPAIIEAEKQRKKLGSRIQKALLDRNILQSFTDRVQRPSSSKPIQRRVDLRMDIQGNTNTYKDTSAYRQQSVQTCGITRYALSAPGTLEPFSNDPSAHNTPGFVWQLEFKRIEVDIDVSSDVWEELSFSVTSLYKWWRRRHAHLIPSESDGWSDMKRLARRVVIQILERIGSSSLKGFRHIDHLKSVAERAREIVLFQPVLCYNLPSKWVPDLQELFEFTVPVIYLVSEITRASQMIPPNAIAENKRIEIQLQTVGPYLKELRKRCYILGDRAGFNVYDYISGFKDGAVFDFRAFSRSIHHDYRERGIGKAEKGDFIKLDQHLAGGTESKYWKRMGSTDEKQLRVKEVVRVAADPGSELSTDRRGNVVRLIPRDLEELGLKELKDIVYNRQRWRGSGSYADVFEMYRASETKPVAVKIYKAGVQTAKRLKREARTWVKLDHKHVVRLLGFVIFAENQAFLPCLVSELCHTDLKRFMKEHKKAVEASKKKPLTETCRLKFLRDIVVALDYLHACGISHGDLRAANVLVTNDRVDEDSCYAVLNDFGLAEYTEKDINRLLDSRDLSSINQRTNDYWLAPELMLNQPRPESKARVSKSGDIYAFGVVYLEVMYERDPYEGTLHSIEYAKSTGELPAKKEDLIPENDEHWALMRSCWENVDKRWDVQEVARAVRLIRASPCPPADWVSPESGVPKNTLGNNIPSGA